MMNAQRLAVVKIVPNSMKSKKLRKATMSGEYKKIAKRTCRVVKYPMESTSAAASSRLALFSPDFTGPQRPWRPAGAPVAGWPLFEQCCSH